MPVRYSAPKSKSRRNPPERRAGAGNSSFVGMIGKLNHPPRNCIAEPTSHEALKFEDSARLAYLGPRVPVASPPAYPTKA